MRAGVAAVSIPSDRVLVSILSALSGLFAQTVFWSQSPQIGSWFQSGMERLRRELHKKSQSPQIGSWFQLRDESGVEKIYPASGLNPLRSGLGFNGAPYKMIVRRDKSLNPLRSGLGFNKSCLGGKPNKGWVSIPSDRVLVSIQKKQFLSESRVSIPSDRVLVSIKWFDFM